MFNDNDYVWVHNFSLGSVSLDDFAILMNRNERVKILFGDLKRSGSLMQLVSKGRIRLYVDKPAPKKKVTEEIEEFKPILVRKPIKEVI